MKDAHARGWLVATGLLWLVGVTGGLVALTRYALTPGPTHAAPERWPEDSVLARKPGRPTLVLLAHPRCPCTRASMGELSVLMARSAGTVDAFVLFLRPEGTADGWEQGPLWKTAAAIPGVTVLRDADGAEARRFGASTSGHVLLYDRDGRLRFSGGITRARGHAGDNPGSDAVRRVLRGDGDGGEAPVYGCALESPEPDALADGAGGSP